MLDIQYRVIAMKCPVVGMVGSAELPSYLQVGLRGGRVLRKRLLRLPVLLDILGSQPAVGCF